MTIVVVTGVLTIQYDSSWNYEFKLLSLPWSYSAIVATKTASRVIQPATLSALCSLLLPDSRQKTADSRQQHMDIRTFFIFRARGWWTWNPKSWIDDERNEVWSQPKFAKISQKIENPFGSWTHWTVPDTILARACTVLPLDVGCESNQPFSGALCHKPS